MKKNLFIILICIISILGITGCDNDDKECAKWKTVDERKDCSSLEGNAKYYCELANEHREVYQECVEWKYITKRVGEDRWVKMMIF